MSVRIGVVDDHCIICNGICNILKNNCDYTVVFCAYNAEDCLSLLQKEENFVDVLLLDISMPHMNGFEVYHIIKQLYFHIKIIFLTSSNDYSHFSHALDIGADGYVLKNIDFPELEIAINRVNRGIQYFDQRLITLLLKYNSGINNKKERLTNREKEILNCVVSGMMNKEIAFLLNIKEETVKNHLVHIYKKFKVADRTQATVYAIKNHYIDL